MEYRIERDSMGEVRVPADRYWGAQTQRSHENFPIGVGIETMPAEIIRAFAVLKKAAAIANRELLPARMSAEKCALIGRVCDEILAGELDGHFPLVVWQTGSGTQSNMNVNEVIANRGNELAGKKLLHPNDDVNMSQSSNDTFPTAMHIAACLAVEDRLLPAVSALEQTLLRLEAENTDVLKSGRTHLQDATPITFAQACLGAELEIPTIDGKVKYELPEGTQSGTTFRLKGKGIPELNGRGRGDQYVTVYIETPRNLNREQKEALKKFAESVGDNNYEERKKFFKKFKK